MCVCEDIWLLGSNQLVLLATHQSGCCFLLFSLMFLLSSEVSHAAFAIFCSAHIQQDIPYAKLKL